MTQVKLLYIHAYRHRFGVEPICAVLSEHGMTIAPQTYYKWLAYPIRPAELEEAYLVDQIVDIFWQNKCVYGVRRMWHAARRAGLPVGRDPVGRLMRIAGIHGVRRGVHRTVATTRDECAPRHPDLVKRVGRRRTGRLRSLQAGVANIAVALRHHPRDASHPLATYKIA